MLKLQDVRFSYQGTDVLRGIDIEVAGSEVVGIIGPNGAGKTTLLKLISGVIKPSTGDILINSKASAEYTPSERARLVAVAPQTPPLPEWYKVIDLVLMGRNAHLKLYDWESKNDYEVALNAMQMTDTLQFADRAITTLSGGERQRVVIAMAVAQETPLILLDEPTANLDIAHQSKVLDIVATVQRKRQGAVIIAMHDLSLAAQYCDRLIMLAEGVVHADGPPEDVLKPEIISRAYHTEVIVMRHPTAGSPVVVGVRK